MRPIATAPATPTISAPPAAQTPSTPLAAPVHTERVAEKIVAETPKMSAAAQALADAHIEIAPEAEAPASTLSLNELRGDKQSEAGVVTAASETATVEDKDEDTVAASSPSERHRTELSELSAAVRRLAAATGLGEIVLARGLMDIWTGARHRQDQARGNNWMLIAACVAAVAGVFGGVFYFRAHSAAPVNNSATKPNDPALPQQLAFRSPAILPNSPRHQAAR